MQVAEKYVGFFDSHVLPLFLNSKSQAPNFKQIPITNVPICNLEIVILFLFGICYLVLGISTGGLALVLSLV
jgi:hypothetical protein